MKEALTISPVMSSSSRKNITTVISQFGKRLLSFIRQRVPNDADAEDILQDVWYQFTTTVETEPIEQVSSWLFTVARNIVIDDWRARQARPETPVDEVPEQRRSTEDDADDQLLLSWVVAEALTHLSEDHRTVLLECYYRGRPVAEVARRLGVPAGTVKSRTHYALRALKLALEEMGVSA